jgi:23S rRNA (cytosine1962-C5)-methyltransferase
MREIHLVESQLSKLKVPCATFKKDAIKESLKSFQPGEWLKVLDHVHKTQYLGFVNPMIEDKFPCLQILAEIKREMTPEELIAQRLDQAIYWRKRIQGYEDCARLVFGVNDFLPGLIVDSYANAILLQINNAGFDRYREFIKNFLESRCKKPAYFWDQEKQRAKEMLPLFEKEIGVDSLLVNENKIQLKVDLRSAQKIGYYYDHRENRLALESIIQRLNFKASRGLDLFSYVGAWGKYLLRAGVKHVTMVDQGDFQSIIDENFQDSKDRFKFVRENVFQYLDQVINLNEEFDIIISDPPAFAKSPSQKDQARVGYDRIHQKCLRLLKNGGLLVAASCTHYISQEELSQSVFEASKKERKKLRLLYQGVQGWDHPFSKLNDQSHYIKCLIYSVENL